MKHAANAVLILIVAYMIFLLTACTAKPNKKIGVFYNYYSEHSESPFIEAEIELPSNATDEDARRAYEEWLAQQVPSGAAGWSWEK